MFHAKSGLHRQPFVFQVAASPLFCFITKNVAKYLGFFTMPDDARGMRQICEPSPFIKMNGSKKLKTPIGVS